MTARATPPDLLAEFRRVQERLRTWQLIASWLADYQERVRTAGERFEAELRPCRDDRQRPLWF